MSGIRIVTKSECPFCSMAKNWLKEHSFEYVEDLIDNEVESKLFVFFRLSANFLFVFENGWQSNYVLTL